ncbi:MAG: ATP phosphoribosyltransferase regulatory subunit, partial [Desulfovibrio sp.]|nr:ATP phosphoribosyltransferase regulatory subunit [Desulfovibrio sp.]
MSIARINGFADMFEPESTAFTFMESQCRAIFPAYGFKEVRLPVLEYTDLFARSIGTETDVVQKEMYTFPDSKGKPTSLRPEATAGMMRAYIAASLHAKEQVSRLYTFGPMFRHERPQKGRMRQFHQIDCELLGSSGPVADADVVSLLVHFVSSLGIGGLTLRMNSLGCASCRQT